MVLIKIIIVLFWRCIILVIIIILIAIFAFKMDELKVVSLLKILSNIFFDNSLLLFLHVTSKDGIILDFPYIFQHDFLQFWVNAWWGHILVLISIRIFLMNNLLYFKSVVAYQNVILRTLGSRHLRNRYHSHLVLRSITLNLGLFTNFSRCILKLIITLLSILSLNNLLFLISLISNLARLLWFMMMMLQSKLLLIECAIIWMNWGLISIFKECNHFLGISLSAWVFLAEKIYCQKLLLIDFLTKNLIIHNDMLLDLVCMILSCGIGATYGVPSFTKLHVMRGLKVLSNKIWIVLARMMGDNSLSYIIILRRVVLSHMIPWDQILLNLFVCQTSLGNWSYINNIICDIIFLR